MPDKSGVWPGMKWGRRLPKRSWRQFLLSDVRSKVCGPNTLWMRDHTLSERVQLRSEYCSDGASAGFSTEGTYCISIEKLNSWLHLKTTLRTSFISELLPPSLFHKPSRDLLSGWTSMRECWECCRESWLWRHPKNRTKPWPQENIFCPTHDANHPLLQFCHYATTTRLPKLVWKRRNIKRQRCAFPFPKASNLPSHPRIANIPTQTGEDQGL